MNVSTILRTLRSYGFRITKARKALIEIFFQADVPLTAHDLHHHLQALHVYVDKSTVYRELHFLKDKKIIKPMKLFKNELHYEATHKPHHHHIICTVCGMIYPLQSTEVEQAVSLVMDQTKKEKNFQIKEHTIEFYGVCSQCNTTN